MSNAVTTQMLRPGDVDEAAYAKFVAKILKSNLRARDKGRTCFAGMTDDECREAARSYCVMYRHQFRVLVPVA